MASFICKVLTPQGQIVKIKMTESDKITCLKKLKRNGMNPISVKSSFSILKRDKKLNSRIYSKRKSDEKNSNNPIIQLSNKVTLEEIKEFTQKFYLLKKSKFTNVHALKTIESNTRNLELKKVLKVIVHNVEKGIPIYKTMKEYETIFPFEYIYLIKTGELTNSLEDSLEHAIRYLEDEQNLREKIQKTLVPNVIMFLAIIVMTFLALLVGVPLIKNIFLVNGANMNLPKGILIASFITEKMVKYWYIILIVIIAGIASFIRFINTSEGRFKFDYFKCTSMVFGRLEYLLNFSRLLGSIEINLKNEMRLQDALDVSKNVIKNKYMLHIVDKSINNIYTGKSWLEPFENENMLGPIIVEMLKKGSKDELVEIMGQVVGYLDIEIENEINKLLKVLPEISYAIVGIALLLFIIIILIPIIQVYLGGWLFV